MRDGVSSSVIVRGKPKTPSSRTLPWDSRPARLRLDHSAARTESANTTNFYALKSSSERKRSTLLLSDAMPAIDSVKVLAFSGSPHTEGNVEHLIGCVLEGAT